AVQLAARSRCGSRGPLGTGHLIWYITAKPGVQELCQVTDETGCRPGDDVSIGFVEVCAPDGTNQIAKKGRTNEVPFTCPDMGQVRCQVNFNDNYHGLNYRIHCAYLSAHVSSPSKSSDTMGTQSTGMRAVSPIWTLTHRSERRSRTVDKLV
ncbi:hypothetical protein BD413DRAFT_481968, partial [Trametes elegans]